MGRSWRGPVSDGGHGEDLAGAGGDGGHGEDLVGAGSDGGHGEDLVGAGGDGGHVDTFPRKAHNEWKHHSRSNPRHSTGPGRNPRSMPLTNRTGLKTPFS